MADSAIHYSNLTRICEYARALHQLHHGGGDDEVLEREFNAVCRAIWGYTLDDFTDDELSPEDHAWLGKLGKQRDCTLGESKGCVNLRSLVSKLWEMCEIILNPQVPRARTRTSPPGEATIELPLRRVFHLYLFDRPLICRIRLKPVARVSARQIKWYTASLYELR
jgi:hypothetical protein